MTNTAREVLRDFGMYPGDPVVYELSEPYDGASHVVICRLCNPCSCAEDDEHELRAVVVLTDARGVMLDQSMGFMPHWQSEGAATHGEALAALGYEQQ